MMSDSQSQMGSGDNIDNISGCGDDGGNPMMASAAASAAGPPLRQRKEQRKRQAAAASGRGRRSEVESWLPVHPWTHPQPLTWQQPGSQAAA